jgi:hypothetical protein
MKLNIFFLLAFFTERMGVDFGLAEGPGLCLVGVLEDAIFAKPLCLVFGRDEEDGRIDERVEVDP